MNTRTTKIFINTQDTEVGNVTYYDGTLSGYMNVTLTDEFDETISVIKQYHITTTKRTEVDHLGHWRAGYLGRAESYRSYYGSEFENVRVKTGSISESINNNKGRRNVACWIAAYDDKILAFEIHYPNGSIFRVTDLVISKNALLQRESDWLLCENTVDRNFVVMAERKETLRRKRVDSKLSVVDEEKILEMMKDKLTQKYIANFFNVTQPLISQLKKRFKDEGLLT